jgi:His/Glu/Gln/Arg/opine family amino acid ABC transporter permease subunit
LDRLLDTFANVGVLAQAWPAVFAGFLVTVEVAVATVLLGLGLGFALALLRSLDRRLLNWTITAWVDVFRTLPQLVVLVFAYFALPYAGVRIGPFLATTLALGAVLSAFAAEAFRAAILAVPGGQWDAARALGLGWWQTMRRVVLPQAVRLATPLLTNRSIAIVKGTALGTAVSLPELLGEAQASTSMLANPSPLLLAAGLYLVLFLPLVVLSRRLERRYGPA